MMRFAYAYYYRLIICSRLSRTTILKVKHTRSPHHRPITEDGSERRLPNSGTPPPPPSRSFRTCTKYIFPGRLAPTPVALNHYRFSAPLHQDSRLSTPSRLVKQKIAGRIFFFIRVCVKIVIC